MPTVDTQNFEGAHRCDPPPRRARPSPDRLPRRPPRPRVGAHGASRATAPRWRRPASSSTPTSFASATSPRRRPRIRPASCSRSPSGRPRSSPPTTCRRSRRCGPPSELGLPVPDDLSIVGFDNIPESALTDPPLTTVDQSIQAIGREAVRLLIDLIEHPDATGSKEPIHVTLPTRSSCVGRPPRYLDHDRRAVFVAPISETFTIRCSRPPGGTRSSVVLDRPSRRGLPRPATPHQGGTHMTNTRTRRRAFALVAALALVAGACGDDDDDSADPVAEPTATDTAEPAATDAPNRRPPPPSRPPTASRSRSIGGTSRTTIRAGPTGRTWPTRSWPSTRTSRSRSR